MINYCKAYIIIGLILSILTGQFCIAANLGEPQSQSKITGVAVDNKNKPVPGAFVTFYPSIAPEVKTDVNGIFSVVKKPGINFPPNDYEATPYIMVRNIERNLVMAEQLSNNTENLHLELSTGIILSGKVVDPNGRGIRDAKLGFGLKPYSSRGTYIEPGFSDEHGNFEIKAAPADFNCVCSAQAAGFGIVCVEIHTRNNSGEHINLNPIVLPFANLTISGFVVDVNDKPVANVHVFTTGPEVVQTDVEGKFILKKVYAGGITVTAEEHGTSRRGEVRTEGGASNVKIVISSLDSSSSEPHFAALTGKLLPDIKSFIADFDVNKFQAKRILVCFFDMEQRPSRNCIIELSKNKMKSRKRI